MGSPELVSPQQHPPDLAILDKANELPELRTWFYIRAAPVTGDSNAAAATHAASFLGLCEEGRGVGSQERWARVSPFGLWKQNTSDRVVYNDRNLFLTVLEAGSLRLGCRCDQVVVFFWAEGFSLCSHTSEGARDLPGSLFFFFFFFSVSPPEFYIYVFLLKYS